MKSPRNWFVYIFGSFLVCVLISGAVYLYAVYAANQAAPTRPLVRIKEMIPESLGVANQPVVVFADANDPDGIADVALWVNGQQAGTQTNPDQASLLPFETSQAWIPTAAGNYLIVLKATDRKGFVGESDPLSIQVQERALGPDPNIAGEYEVQEGDTLETIAERFGTTPEDLLARNPGLGELTPGTRVLVPPRPEEATSGEAADAPAPAGGAGPARIDPPVPAPPPGDETDVDPSPEPFWAVLPLPDGFICLINPELCAPTRGGAGTGPFPAPSGVGSAPGEGCAIEVSWTDTSENEQGFRIYRFASRPRFRMDMLAIVELGSGSGLRLRFLDTSPPRGELFYAIVAYNAGGDIWSGPSANVESEGCPPAGPILGQALVVEALEMNVTGGFDRLYCYASLADSPFERIPYGTSSFINLEAGVWNLAEHFSGVNKREVMTSAVDPLNIVVECLGWQGDELINLGRFARSHPPEEWDGRSLVAGPDSGSFNITYRINFSFHTADEGGRADWPLIDSRLGAPYALQVVTNWTECTGSEPGRTCVEATGRALFWQYSVLDPGDAEPDYPTAFKVYRRSGAGGVLEHIHTTPYGGRHTFRLPEEDCNISSFYAVSAVHGYDPITGEEIQSPLSEELLVPPTCASLEITLDFLWNYNVDDGDFCTIFVDCTTFDYEAYGWLDFNGQRIRWNNHCDGACTYVGPSYTVLEVASEHLWSAQMLNIGDGWRRNNNIIRIPIEDGEALALTFTFMDHDEWTEDTNFCGATGRPQIVAAARSASEWRTFDQALQTDDGNCIIGFRVRGMPALP